MERGFSLSEVLVSLLLIVSVSCTLLKQQWQFHRMVNQNKLQALHWLQTSNTDERGMSLLELLFALGLGFSLILFSTQLFLNIEQQFLKTQFDVQQTARWQLSLSLMRRVIQHSGFTPCLPLNALRTLNKDTHQPLQSLRIEKENPSVIHSYRMGDNFSMIQSIVDQNQVVLDEPRLLSPPLLIADCFHAEVIEAVRQHGRSVFVQQPLVFHYEPPIYVGEWQDLIFGLRPTHQLYYKHKHREILMSSVHTLSWEWQDTPPSLWVHADIQLEHEPAHRLDIRLRNQG